VVHALEELADGPESGLSSVEPRERLLDRRDDALLLGQRWDRELDRSESVGREVCDVRRDS
jgi:hypothetical protein